MSTPTISSQRLVIIPTPFDAKRCNYYIDGSNVVIETIAEYLLRVTSDIRDNNLISMYIPKDGYTSLGTYPLVNFDAILSNFDTKIYAFVGGLGDGDLTEILGPDSVKPNPFKMVMPAGDLPTKVAGAAFTPIGWASVAQSGDTNIIVTNTLTDREARFINVFEVDSGNKRWLSAENGMAYSGFVNNGLTTLIEGFAPTLLPVEVAFIFD